MTRTKPPPAPRPTKTSVEPAVAARVLPMQAEKQRRAARSAMTSVVARLHHLDDPGLCVLARAVWDELREREMTAAREQEAAVGAMVDEEMGAR